MIHSVTRIGRSPNETALINGHTIKFRSWHEANDAYEELLTLGVRDVDIRKGLTTGEDGKWHYLKFNS